jgi:hypothetical protein
MENNPFTSVIKNIREYGKTQMPAIYRLGNVISVAPLIVEVAGMSQEDDVLLKNDLILQLKIGDELLLFPIEEEQRFIILCKVVSV